MSLRLTNLMIPCVFWLIILWFPARAYTQCSASITPDPAMFCQGDSGTINGNPTGGSGNYISHSWTGSGAGYLNDTSDVSPVFTAEDDGSFTLIYTVEDNVGCIASDTILVQIFSLPLANAGFDDSVCYGDSIPLNASGGSEYSWNPITGLSNPGIANPMASPETTTLYTVTVTSEDNCSSTDQVLVTVNALPSASAGNDVSFCVGGSAQLSASGGSMYSWSPTTALNNPNIPNPEANPTITTVYTVTVTDMNDCSSTDQVIVTVNPLPSANAGNSVSICAGSSTQLNASGGSMYSWSPATGLNNPNIANPVANPTMTTVYTVTVTDMNDCSNTDQVVVTVNPLPSANAGDDVSICAGNSAQLSASGGTIYNWSPMTGLNNPNIANPVANPTVTTVFTVTVTDMNDCSSTDQVVVTVNLSLVVNAGADSAVCIGDSIMLNAAGGVMYSWNPTSGLSNPNIANPMVSPSITTTYTVTATDNNGCSGTDQVVVHVNPLPVANAGADRAICLGDSTQLNASGGVAYSWTPTSGLSDPNVSNPKASPAITTAYTLIVSDNNLCASSDQITVTVNPTPVANAGGDKSICQGSSTPLNASGGVKYMWAPSFGLSNSNIQNPIASPTSTTNYTVTVENNYQCKDTDDVTVMVLDTPQIQIEIFDTSGLVQSDGIVCSGDPVRLKVSGGQTYQWFNQTTADSIVLNPVYSNDTAQSYSVVAFNHYPMMDCSTNRHVNLGVSDNPSADFNIETFTGGLNTGADIKIIDKSMAGDSRNLIHWAWDLGNATVVFPNGFDPGNYHEFVESFVVKYAEGGQKPISLFVTNDHQCKSNVKQHIFIQDTLGPIVDVNIIGDNVCVGKTTLVVDRSRPRDEVNQILTDWHMMIEGGAIISPVEFMGMTNITWDRFNRIDSFWVEWTGPNPGIVTLEVTQLRESTQETLKNTGGDEIEIEETPMVILELDGSYYCVGDLFEFRFSGTPQSIVQYQLNGVSATANANVTLSLPLPIIEQIIIRVDSVELDGCVNNEPQVHIITPRPNPVIDLVLNEEGDTVACQGAPFELFVTTELDNISWLLNNQTVGTENQLVIPTDVTDTLLYKIRGELDGCFDEDSVQVIVVPRPDPMIVGDDSVCLGQVVRYSLMEQEPAGDLSWSVSGGNIITGSAGENEIDVQWQSAGTISVSQNIGACIEMDTQSISINEEESPPYVELVYLNKGGVLLYPNPGLLPLSYQWFRDDAEVSGEIYQGIYVGQNQPESELNRYSLRVWNSTGSVACAQIINRSVIDYENGSTLSLDLYPNPAADLVYLRFKTDQATMFSLSVCNPIGQFQFENDLIEVLPGVSTHPIKLEHWANGIYYFITRNTQTGEQVVIPIAVSN